METILVSARIMPNVPGERELSISKNDFVIAVQKGSTVEDLLARIAEDAGPNFSYLVYDRVRRQLDPKMIVLINGKAVRPQDGLYTELSHNDKITVGAVMLGG